MVDIADDYFGVPRTPEDDPASCSREMDAGRARDIAAVAGVLRLADVEPERLEWLWPGRFPVGKLVMLDGDPSRGKSTLALAFAAHVSTGKPWPDGAPCPLGDVVLMSAEDGLADTIRPRLDAAEGDPARVHALTAVPHLDEDGDTRYRPPTLADTPVIRAVIERTGARLLIIDVLMAFMPGKVDSHRDQDVRGVLHQLAAVADDTGCTVLLLRHLNKAGGSAAMYRGGGSIGIIGAARAGYLVAKDPDDETQRVLACIKSNLAAEPPSLTYRLESAPGSHVARIVWGGESQHAAAALLSTGSDEDRSERDEAKQWLTDYLADEGGSAPAKEVKAAARAAGLAERTVDRARAKAGVTTARDGFGKGAVYVWRLPEESCSPHARHARQDSEAGIHGIHGGEHGNNVIRLEQRDGADPEGAA